MCIYSAVPAMMFVILQKYDFSSKSQRMVKLPPLLWDVCDTAKVRFFKQITTGFTPYRALHQMFVILQKYDFSSKSQLKDLKKQVITDVCDTAKVRFFKQITTRPTTRVFQFLMFVILQKYDFSSKSQLSYPCLRHTARCL